MYINFKKLEPIIKDILSTPTAPFNESIVIKKIVTYLKRFKLNTLLTKYNNIIAHWDQKKNRENLYFISHMDHPGFLVAENSKGNIVLKVMGGIPYYAKNFREVAEINISTGEKYIHKVKRIVKKENEIFVEVKTSKEIDENNIFTLNLRSYLRKNDIIHAHTIDDLGGCAAQVSAISYLFEHAKELDANIYFVFTRAEEVGFIGLLSLIKNNYFFKDGYYISCETSKCIPPVRFGNGVVLRLGDKAGIFEQGFTNSLLSYFQKKMSLEHYQIQRALLDGGTCEATPLVIRNFKVSGLACPLGNYHNFSDNNTIKEEYIHIKDFTSYVNTIIEISLNFSKIVRAYKKEEIQQRIDANYKRMKLHLMGGKEEIC